MLLQRVSGGGVEWLAYAPDGKVLYTADSSGTHTAWDQKGKVYRKLFRADAGPGRTNRAGGLFLAGQGKYLVVRIDPPLVWDLKGEDIHARVPTVQPSHLDLRLMPGDENRLVYVADSRRSIATWDIATRKPGPTYTGWTRTSPLASFDVAPDGRTAALLDKFGLVVLYDLPDSREVTRFSCPYGTERVSFSPDGKTLAVFTGKQVRLWDMPAGTERVAEVRIQPQYAGFAFHPTTPFFAAVNTDRLLALFDLQTGQQVRVYDFALARYVQSVTFAPDGKKCAAGGINKQFIVFDVDPTRTDSSTPGMPGLRK